MAVAVAVQSVWVAIQTAGSATTPSGSLTEVDPSTGAVLNVLSARSYHFDGPDALGRSGSDLYARSFLNGCGCATEVSDSTGGRIRWLFMDWSCNRAVASLAVSSDHVWVSEGNLGQIVELAASTGRRVRTITIKKVSFSNMNTTTRPGPVTLASNGRDLFAVNAKTGTELLDLSAASYEFDGVSSLATDGVHLWATNANEQSFTEIADATGVLTRVITNAA